MTASCRRTPPRRLGATPHTPIAQPPARPRPRNCRRRLLRPAHTRPLGEYRQLGLESRASAHQSWPCSFPPHNRQTRPPCAARARLCTPRQCKPRPVRDVALVCGTTASCCPAPLCPIPKIYIANKHACCIEAEDQSAC
ncbi:hypothetical protein C8J57DRAFT_1715016 [Mycena rebaudengoi]|nr:hypothetical protein C8J57DRAFT_1715016 [Mycena rebaudengoi]